MPGDFREHFDLRKLDEIQLGQIEFVLTSPAYEESFRPFLLDAVESMSAQWKDRSEERKARYPDDYLAGGVVAIEGLIKFFEVLVQEANFERIHAANGGGSPEREYDLRRLAGQLQPVIGLDQGAEPSADEDF